MFNPISQTLTKLAARIPASKATVLGKAYANIAGPNSAGTFSKNFSQMMMDKAKATAANKKWEHVGIREKAKMRLGAAMKNPNSTHNANPPTHKFDKPFKSIRGVGWD